MPQPTLHLKMNSLIVVLTSILYLMFLFGIAYWAEKRSEKGKSFTRNPYVYSLSLAIYCTAWTFYGSVGRAANHGIDFLIVYIGPTLIMPLWWLITRKIIRITKTHRITSIADFISARYGKNISLGVLVTLVCLVGTMPYISIQLKAISSSFFILTGSPHSDKLFLSDVTFYIAIGLGIFTIIFGTRKLDSLERHEGLVSAIAVESLIKIIAFSAIGIFITYYLFNGFEDIFSKAYAIPSLRAKFTIPETNGYATWFWYTLAATSALLFLPRQFQVSIVENIDENHLKKALWLFPLYLLIINIFVLPIAFGGNLLFPKGNVNPDNFVLAIPMYFNANTLALITYLGGFSAATSMIIVETIALSIMVSNSILIPLFLAYPKAMRSTSSTNLSTFVNRSRRVTIIILLLLAYVYARVVAEHFSLVTIGMISFSAVTQFTPAIIGGIYWREGTKQGALLGIIVGTIVWFYTLVFPLMVEAGLYSNSILQSGLGGITWLNPYQLFGLKGMDTVAHGIFWSLFFNTFCYLIGSALSKPSTIELNQAVLFVGVVKQDNFSESASIWRGTAYMKDIKVLLNNFFTEKRTNRVLMLFAQRHGINLNEHKADPRLVAYAEKVLAGIVGSASARIMISSISVEENLSMDEVLNILRTSQALVITNKELKTKSLELERATNELKNANEILQKADTLKDDFLSTVAHEIRTPLTSIRALSEIVHDNPSMDEEEREHFLGTVIKESDRLSRLINQVLDLEKYQSGKQPVSFTPIDIQDVIKDSIEAIFQQAKEKNILITFLPNRFTPKITGDYDKLIQVIVNLLSNAIKYCANDTGHIQISIHHDDDFVYTAVQDNGAGIDRAFQRLIFDKFYQAEDQTIKKPKGSGLGLAISKKIIELHQGNIWVDSEIGKGSTFTFKIPINTHVSSEDL